MMIRMTRRLLLTVLLLATLSGTAAAQTAPATHDDTLRQLTAAYYNPQFDPSADAWGKLVASPHYADAPIVFLEIAALNSDMAAKTAYSAFLDAITPVIQQAGGEVILTYDIIEAGTGNLYDLEGMTYQGGMAYAVRYPSRAAYVQVLLDPAVIAANAGRVTALRDVQMMLGKDTLPALFAAMPKNVAASTIATPNVDGKSPDDLLDELLSIYPDGGADPNRTQLETMLNDSGFADEPLYYLNLYAWGSHGAAGASEQETYNQQAQGDVLAHGARVYARVDIEQNLVGPYHWDRLVMPRWPSFKVFTDLRLTPSYVKAQAHRVDSADIYGNYITAAHPAASAAPPSTGQTFRDVRYCEVLATYREGVKLRTEVWNTLGLNDCPQAQWTALKADALKQELGALNINLNGPRYWVLDEISAQGGITSSNKTATFGGLQMTLRAEVQLSLSDLVSQQPYTNHTVDRSTRYVFHAGLPVYELLSPKGDVYVMQSYSQIVDPTLTLADLTDLGSRLTLPEGWQYRVLTPETNLVLGANGTATVIRDDLENTYQLVTSSDAS